MHLGHIDYYRAFRHRMEFSAGLTSKLQTSVFLNVNTETARVASIQQLGSVITVGSALESENQISFSNQWKYKLSDHIANAFGSALYAEASISGKEIELEANVIIDKLVGRTMHAVNFIARPVFESVIEDGVVEQKMKFFFEGNYGLMHHINKSWNIGFELRNLNKTTEENGWEYSILYAGPGISYSSGSFQLNFSCLPQVAGLFEGLRTNFHNGKELVEHEKLETRLLIAFSF